MLAALPNSAQAIVSVFIIPHSKTRDDKGRGRSPYHPKAKYAPKRIFREIRFGALCLPFQEELVKIEEK